MRMLMAGSAWTAVGGVDADGDGADTSTSGDGRGHRVAEAGVSGGMAVAWSQRGRCTKSWACVCLPKKNKTTRVVAFT
jgi:hypothetical protein